MHEMIREAAGSDLFVEVPGLPLGLDRQAKCFHAVPGADHWEPTICIAAALTKKKKQRHFGQSDWWVLRIFLSMHLSSGFREGTHGKVTNDA